MPVDRRSHSLPPSPDQRLDGAFEDVLARRAEVRARRVEAEADPLDAARREAYFFAVAAADASLDRLTGALARSTVNGSRWQTYSPTEATLLADVAGDLSAYAHACEEEVRRSRLGGEPREDDPTPRQGPYPTLSLAEKAAVTAREIARLCMKLSRLLERAVGVDQAAVPDALDARRAFLVLMELEEGLRERRHWLDLEVEALCFLDMLARFRDLCVVFERVMLLPVEDPRAAPARQELTGRLNAMARELAGHPLGKPLARLCRVDALDSERRLRQAMNRLVAYERHALVAYGIPFHPMGHLDRHRLDRIHAQQRSLVGVEKRVAFLQAFFEKRS